MENSHFRILKLTQSYNHQDCVVQSRNIHSHLWLMNFQGGDQDCTVGQKWSL